MHAPKRQDKSPSKLPTKEGFEIENDFISTQELLELDLDLGSAIKPATTPQTIPEPLASSYFGDEEISDTDLLGLGV